MHSLCLIFKLCYLNKLLHMLSSVFIEPTYRFGLKKVEIKYKIMWKIKYYGFVIHFNYTVLNLFLEKIQETGYD